MSLAFSYGSILTMLFTQITTLKSCIVEVLALEPQISAEELRLRVGARYRGFSRRAVYKELKILEKEGVVLRSKAGFSLQMLWVINMASLFHDAYLTLARAPGADLSETGDGGPLIAPSRMNFQNLGRLDYTWMQVMLLLMRRYPSETVFVFKPEQWFYLVHENITSMFLSAVGKIRSKTYHVIGNDCFVNRKGAAMLRPSAAKVVFQKDLLGLGDSTYITVIGDCLLTVKLDSKKATRMRELFSSVKNEADLARKKCREFLSSSFRSSLKIEFRPKALNDYKDRFRSII